MKRARLTSMAVAMGMCAPVLSACQASNSDGGAANTSNGNGSVLTTTSMANGSAQTAAAFDPAKIGPGDLWTGKAITDGFGVACPFAANTGGRPDVAGVALGMTLQNAVSNLACRYPEAEFTVNGNENRNPYVTSGGASYGLNVKFKPKDGRAYETFDLFVSGPRGEEKTVGVWRTVYYQPQNAPLIAKIAGQMREKYGAFDQLSEEQGLAARGAWTRVNAQNGQTIAVGDQRYLTCLRAVNFGQANYADDGSIDGAADAGCGDTVVFNMGTSVGAGLVGNFVTFLFNPSFAKAQSALTTSQAEADSAARDADTQRQAGQRPGPEL